MTEWMVYGLMGASLAAYLLTAGADFGGGIWDLFATGTRATRQREAIAKAIAPIWEANHIWIIFVVVLLFSIFPLAFAAISIALHIPLTLALIGIVLRGSAFVFRSYGLDTPTWRSGWGRVFAISSLLTPICLGATFAALATGHIEWTAEGGVSSGFIAGWTTPFAGLVGLMTTAMCALLAAVYLAVEVEGELRGDFRRRALGAQIATGAVGTAALGGAARDAEAFFAALTGGALGPAVVAATMLAGFITLGLLWRATGDRAAGHLRAARIGAAAQAVGALGGFAVAMEGFLVRPGLHYEAAGARPETLGALGPVLIVGALILVPSMIALYRVFKAQRPDATAPGD